jgi:hypothetical protein
MSATAKRQVPRLSLTQNEAAEALGISVDHFERHVKQELPVVCVGGIEIFPVRGIEEWQWQPRPRSSRPSIPYEDRLRVYARDSFQCRYCGSGEFLSLDHIYPWSRGGSDDETNLQTLCRSCNSRKGARVGSVA